MSDSRVCTYVNYATPLYIIQIYQALRKDSGNYTSEGNWHISIFPRGEAPRKNRKIASPPKMCNFHYPFEIKAWYICFISLLYKFKTYTKIWRNRFGFATRGNNVSQCTDWMTCPSVRRSACSCSSCLHDVICQILIIKFLEIQSFSHSAKFTKTSTSRLSSSGLCRRAWSQAAMFVYKKISDPKRDLDRVPGLTGDLRRYCRRQVYELSVYIQLCLAQRSVCSCAARWNWNKFCYALVSMRSSAQEEDNIIEHAQCCPGKDIEKYLPLFRLMVKLFFTLRAAIDQSRS